MLHMVSISRIGEISSETMGSMESEVHAVPMKCSFQDVIDIRYSQKIKIRGYQSCFPKVKEFQTQTLLNFDSSFYCF
jgi:hypothetical protein